MKWDHHNPRGPRSCPSYAVSSRHYLVDPIRPTRGHIAFSPHGGLYAMPSLCGSAEATHEWFRAFTIIPSWHAVLFDPGELGHRSVQYRDADTDLRRELNGSALPNTPQSVSRGSWFSWLYGSHLLQPAKLLAPRYGSNRIAPRSTGAFTSKLSTGRSPFQLLDMTTTASLDSFCRRDLHPLE